MSAYKISKVSLPLALVPLKGLTPPGHSLDPRYAASEQEALEASAEWINGGYGVEISGPAGKWDQADVLRRLNLTAAYLMSRRIAPGAPICVPGYRP